MNVMILAGGREIMSLFDLCMLLLLALAVILLLARFRLRRRRRAASLARPVVREPLIGVEISCDKLDAMKRDLELLVLGDGQDVEGRPWGLYRYRSRETGKLYDYFYSAEARRVIDYPALHERDADSIAAP